jgi:hypothetical protein
LPSWEGGRVCEQSPFLATATYEKEPISMRVFAYLDPGTGSMLLSGILAGGAAVWVSIKRFSKSAYRTLVFWKKFDDEDESTAVNPSAATQHDSTSASTEQDATSATTQHETEKEPV